MLLKLVILDSSPQNAVGIWCNHWNTPPLPMVRDSGDAMPYFATDRAQHKLAFLKL